MSKNILDDYILKKLPDIDFEQITERNSFRGEGLVRKPKVKIKMPKEYREEYEKCENDIFYFILSYVKIISLDNGIVDFKLRPYQVELIQGVIDSNYHITMLARQMGKTVTISAIILWHVIFKHNYRIEMVGYKAEVAHNNLSLIKKMYERLPWWLQHGVKVWNVKSIELENGSTIKSMASNGTRGGSVNFLYIDEMGLIPKDEEFWAAVVPLISSGTTTKLAITSTPKGMNLFHKVWTEAVEGTNGFKSFFAPYYVDPIKTEEWARDMEKTIGTKSWIQEYLCRFEGSSDTLIDGSVIGLIPVHKPLNLLEDGKSYTAVYSLPIIDKEDDKKSHDYIILSDVSEGDGGDFSTITIIDITTNPYEVVFVYRSNYINPYALAVRLNELGYKYNEALISIEVNGPGLQTCDVLFNDLLYKNVLTTVKKDPTKKFGIRKPGIRMTAPVKSAGCTRLKGLVENNLLIIKDKLIKQELFTFESSGSSYKAINGKHDDLVMNLVLFAYILKLPIVESMLRDTIEDSIIKNIDATGYNDSYTQIFIYDNGLSGIVDNSII